MVEALQGAHEERRRSHDSVVWDKAELAWELRRSSRKGLDGDGSHRYRR
jgi:hypothetical protein